MDVELRPEGFEAIAQRHERDEEDVEDITDTSEKTQHVVFRGEGGPIGQVRVSELAETFCCDIFAQPLAFRVAVIEAGDTLQPLEVLVALDSLDSGAEPKQNRASLIRRHAAHTADRELDQASRHGAHLLYKGQQVVGAGRRRDVRRQPLRSPEGDGYGFGDVGAELEASRAPSSIIRGRRLAVEQSLPHVLPLDLQRIDLGERRFELEGRDAKGAAQRRQIDELVGRGAARVQNRTVAAAEIAEHQLALHQLEHCMKLRDLALGQANVVQRVATDTHGQQGIRLPECRMELGVDDLEADASGHGRPPVQPSLVQLEAGGKHRLEDVEPTPFPAWGGVIGCARRPGDPMDLNALEKHLLHAAGAIVADPLVLRRVIKHDRRAHGLVPHGRCYALSRQALLDVADFEMLRVPLADIPPEVILVARPTPADLRGHSDAESTTELWRAVFHGRVHLALERLAREGKLDDAAVRERIEYIGQTEFDEIRGILRHDDALLPPGNDREVYIEFAATFLELRHFAPALLVPTFPGLSDVMRVDQTLGLDIDPRPLLEEGRPRGVTTFSPTIALPTSATATASAFGPASLRAQDLTVEPVSAREGRALIARGKSARSEGNDVRALLLCARAATSRDATVHADASREVHDALAGLSARLCNALRCEAQERGVPLWADVLRPLAERAGAERTRLRYGVEGRLLYRIQRACVANERQSRIVDMPTWILSLGKRPMVRSADVTRPVIVARQLAIASHAVHETRLASHDRAALSAALRWALGRAESNVRRSLAPRLRALLDKVKLSPAHTPEVLARDKLVDELIDQILRQGFLSFPQLRDAISRNELKLDDLDGPRQWVLGDPLLEADRLLAVELDGIYQRSDIYLRALQRASSVPFGTRIGRTVFLYLVLPMVASFVLLEGVGHIVNPLVHLAGLPSVEILSVTSFVVLSIVAFALIHSEPFRAFSRQALTVVGVILAWAFFRIPRAILTRPSVQRWLSRPAVRMALRRIVLPLLLGVGVYFLTPLRAEDIYLGLAGALGVFAGASGLMGTRIGSWVEDLFVEQLVPTWQVMSRQWIPGLVRLVGGVFGTMMDWLERAIYRVDELLRFHRGDSAVLLWSRALAGLGWATIAYVIRLYVTLLVEPELNPLKHFPVVTVAHKMFVPLTGQMFAIASMVFSPFGSIIGGAMAAVTVFLFPSMTGFLMWELKENYRLYRDARPERLGPTRLGPHGETMRGLLVAGVHSGTVPKLYERLRRAAQRDDELARKRRGKRRSRGESGLARFRAGIREVETGIRRFAERELVASLRGCRRWKHGDLTIDGVDLSSNRIRLRLSSDTLPGGPCEITIEQQGGAVIAGIARPGFLHTLQRASTQGALLFENALAGFYHRAEVDFVREQIEAEIPEGAQYEIEEAGLVVWPTGNFRTEHLYSFELATPTTVSPVVTGDPGDVPPRVLDTRRFLYRHQPIAWSAWVAAWRAADHDAAQVPRLIAGASILPYGARAMMDSTPLPPNVARRLASLPSDATIVDPNAGELPTSEPERR